MMENLSRSKSSHLERFMQYSSVPPFFLFLFLFPLDSVFIFFGLFAGDDVPEPNIQNVQFNSSIDYTGFSPNSLVNETSRTSISTKSGVEVDAVVTAPPPPPLVYFTGYKLPPGNPCEGFRMPPPPSDPKRNGPRRMY